MHLKCPETDSKRRPAVIFLFFLFFLSRYENLIQTRTPCRPPSGVRWRLNLNSSIGEWRSRSRIPTWSVHFKKKKKEKRKRKSQRASERVVFLDCEVQWLGSDSRADPGCDPELKGTRRVWTFRRKVLFKIRSEWNFKKVRISVLSDSVIWTHEVATAYYLHNHTGLTE